MEKKIIAIIIFIIHNSATLYAQWTEEDSVWLNNVLSGKEELRLNPETWRAIQEGTLINERMSPQNQMISAPSQIPIARDFSEYIRPKNPQKAINPWSVPTAVYTLYNMNVPTLGLTYNKAAFATPQSVIDNASRPSGISFDDMLRTLFQPSFRAKTRNRKNATAWKTY